MSASSPRSAGSRNRRGTGRWSRLRLGYVGGRVVAGEDDQRVVGDPGLLDAVDDLADAVVHLGYQVGVTAETFWRRLVEVGVDRLRRVEVGQADVGEERPARARLAPDVVGRLAHDQLVQQRPDLHVELADRGLLAAFRALPYVRGLDARGRDEGTVRRIRGIAALIGGVAVAPPFVEPLVGGQPSLVVSEVPLPEQ